MAAVKCQPQAANSTEANSPTIVGQGRAFAIGALAVVVELRGQAQVACTHLRRALCPAGEQRQLRQGIQFANGSFGQGVHTADPGGNKRRGLSPMMRHLGLHIANEFAAGERTQRMTGMQTRSQS